MSSKNDDNAKETVDVYAISGPGYRETERYMKDRFSNISKAYLILKCTLILGGRYSRLNFFFLLEYVFNNKYK